MKPKKDLNQKELHQLFNRDISEYVFDFNEKQSEEEINGANFIEAKFNVKLKHLPRVNSPDGVKTPDYASIKDKVLLEIKTAVSLEHGIEDAFKKASKQLGYYEPKYRKFLIINADRITNYSNIEIIAKTKEKAIDLDFRFNFFILKNGFGIYYETSK